MQHRFNHHGFLTWLIAFVVVLQCSDIFAQTKVKAKAKKKSKDSGQDAIVIVDGSAIYEAANFDAPVMDYFDRGRKVKISNKIYPGAGGLGSFYKIKVRRGVFGFIADVDLEVKGKGGRAKKRPEPEYGDETDPTILQSDLEDAGENNDGGGSVYFTRYMGLSYMSYGYTETIGKQKKSSNIGFFGFKISGPGTMMGGLPIDYEFSITTEAPDYYSKFASDTSGFIFLTNAMAMFPFYESKSQSIYYGLGLNFRYTKFDVSLKSAPTTPPIDSQEAGVGAVLGLGYALGLGESFCLRFDARYIAEKENYGGFGASIQYKY